MMLVWTAPLGVRPPGFGVHERQAMTGNILPLCGGSVSLWSLALLPLVPVQAQDSGSEMTPGIRPSGGSGAGRAHRFHLAIKALNADDYDIKARLFNSWPGRRSRALRCCRPCRTSG